jgi:hypothetical protein
LLIFLSSFPPIVCFHHCIVSSKIFRAVSLPLCYFPGKNPLPSIEEIIISLYTRFRKYIAMNMTLQW